MDVVLIGKLVGAAIAGLVVAHLGGWDAALQAMVTLSVLDLLTGVWRAVVTGGLDSGVAFKGSVRKLGPYLLVALAVIVDRLTAQDHLVRSMVLMYFCFAEATSVLENYAQAGGAVPEVLRVALAKLGARAASPPGGVN